MEEKKDKKVVIDIIYVSAVGRVVRDTHEEETMESAKKYIEDHFQELSRHKLVPSAETKEEDGMEYDVSVFTAFSLYRIEITDYTDGRAKAVEMKPSEG